MNPLATLKTLLVAASLCLPVSGSANDLEAVDGPNVRTMKHQDGSRAVFTRSPDSRTLTKKTFSANGILTMLTTYRMFSNGNPSGCKIRDGQGRELFKVAYGYHKVTGLLEREVMFDSQVKRTRDGKEIPVQIVAYIYDAEGKRSAPIVYNLLPGKTFEQVFGVKSSELESNPFKEATPLKKAR